MNTRLKQQLADIKVPLHAQTQKRQGEAKQIEIEAIPLIIDFPQLGRP